MPLSFLVIDDFYTDPHAIRQTALSLDFPAPKAPPNFPGRNSRQKLLVKGIDEIVSDLLNEPLVGSTRDAHGHCRISLAADDAKRRYYVHIDPTADWSGILYLSLPEHCRGGTEFYRHKELDTDRAPIYEREFKAMGATSWTEASDKIIQRDSNDLSKWEHLMTIPMRFNRLVLLRPWLWHTAGPSFGDSLENGRLVQLFFFARKPAQG